MNFKELKIKPAYDSTKDDVLTSFYIPVLSNAKEYCRLCGFFSSSSLAVAAKGISKLVENDGKMKIVTSPKLTKEDVEAIVQGHKQKESVIEEKLLTELSNFESEIIRDHVKALAWMVANGKLEIKIIVPKTSEGVPLDSESITKKGMFHQKVGILKDSEGNIISFSGSINETATAWLENIEEFKVFRSWIRGELPYLSSDLEKFRKYWLGGKEIEVLSVPSAVERKMIEIAPKDVSELKLVEKIRENVQLKAIKRFELRDYQKEAMESWFSNDCKGILEIATGLGKTFVAIKCIEELLRKRGRLAVVITVPTVHLINQWKEELEKFGYGGVKIFGSFSQWKQKIMNEIDDFNLGYTSLLVFITTHDTFHSTNFINAISSLKEIFLIADEVHGLGSSERCKGLLEIYKYRLGLSATPKRWFDEVGTKIIEDFFGKVVYEYTLKDAIRDGWLSPYEYYPILVELNDDELARYIKLSKKIAKLYHSSKNGKEKEGAITKFSIRRRSILKNAQQKLAKFEEVISQLSKKRELHHCLVYCSSDNPQQLRDAQRILNKYDILQHKFTAAESAKEREDILKSFEEGKYQALVAMKCLDEGVDVPPAYIAIILASTTNPREFIQRRGRILRKVTGKIAKIYDFIVVPMLDPDPSSEYFELERAILKREMTRYFEFASASLNPGTAYQSIKNIREKYYI